MAVPSGPINTVADVFADPQVVARQMRIDLNADQVAQGTIPTVRSPIQFSMSKLSIERPSPRLGEHDDEIRRALGLPPRLTRELP